MVTLREEAINVIPRRQRGYQNVNIRVIHAIRG
jgi:hypothetical protein